MTESRQDDDGIDWRLTTFDGVRREQLRRWAALSLEQMLMAQEEMAELVLELHGSLTPYDFANKVPSTAVQEPRPSYPGKPK